ncbi:hypothetical protein BBJ28_00010521 [Nothophytophthora sp. Chile5]|nr:hypothetical protein BBJ28_00010521 [Nothophytophthora sp. Chile5]
MELLQQQEEEELLMQEALALLAECQDDDYDAAISRLLLPSDDDENSSNSGNSSSNSITPATGTTTEEASVPATGLGSSGDWGVASLFAPIAAAAVVEAPAPKQQRKKKAVPAPTGNGKKRKTATHNSNRARDERKEELIYLRKTVQTMEARVRSLQLSQRRALAASAAPLGSPGETEAFTAGAITLAAVQAHGMSDHAISGEDEAEDAAMGPVWTEIAARQYQERRRAELENIRLKLILEGQIKMAKSLEKMLTKRTSLRVMESIQGKYLTSLQHRKPTPSDEEDEAIIFERLQKKLETALEDLDAVFEANGLARMEKPYGDAQLRRENGSTILEIYANKVMPFGVQATGQAVWEHFSHAMDHIPSRFVYQKQLKNLETRDDMLVESFGLELVGSRNATAAFRVRQIRRKFTLADRVVIASRVYSEALELSAEPTKGVRLHEKGFTVVKPFLNASGRRGALVQTCYIFRPVIYGHIEDRERILTTLTDFLLDSVPNTINSSNQMIKNFLLDGALRHRVVPRTLTQSQGQESAEGHQQQQQDTQHL